MEEEVVNEEIPRGELDPLGVQVPQDAKVPFQANEVPIACWIVFKKSCWN